MQTVICIYAKPIQTRDWCRFTTVSDMGIASQVDTAHQSAMDYRAAQTDVTGANTTDDPDWIYVSRDVTGIAISAILLVLIILLSILGNLAVILAILKTPRLREKTSNIFLINLSLTDLMNASLVMPSASVALIADDWYLGSPWCYAQCAFNYWFIIVSMLTLSMISIDGYYAVLHPMHYMSIITPKVVKLAVGYAWLQGCVFALVPVFYRWVVYDYWEVVCAIDWDTYSQEGALTYVILAFLFCFLVPAIVMTFCYTKICRVARQKAVGPDIGGGGANAKKNRKAINDRRVIKSLAIVVAIFFLCMTPFCITKLIKICTNTKALPPYLYLVSAWFGYLSSATNPFIYAIFRRDFRRAFKNVFCRGWIFPGRSRSHSSHEGTRMSISETRRRRPSQSVNNILMVAAYNEKTENQPSISGMVSNCESEGRANGGKHL
ncbi:alpha-2Da adrenergic receptor-like [Patiria miniata]|uniref:G-protein coupled receptors family 1 profile domain-containing protein n=1 Tax=Patiria miniata TaxID=46514 RepID=A0A914B0Q8_PATMI|nr:alpha-2Da adrenergic receptor-like [Patiria miniata]